ncbi:MAG: hypothetical protein AB7K24_24425 [Gemmataceae bacterium]
MLFWQDGQPGESNAAATRREARELGQWPVQDGRIRSLSAGGARAVYCLEDGSARLIDLNSGREIRRWANDKHILAAALSSDGNQVALLCGDAIEIRHSSDDHLLNMRQWHHRRVLDRKSLTTSALSRTS